MGSNTNPTFIRTERKQGEGGDWRATCLRRIHHEMKSPFANHDRVRWSPESLPIYNVLNKWRWHWVAIRLCYVRTKKDSAHLWTSQPEIFLQENFSKRPIFLATRSWCFWLPQNIGPSAWLVRCYYIAFFSDCAWPILVKKRGSLFLRDVYNVHSLQYFVCCIFFFFTILFMHYQEIKLTHDKKIWQNIFKNMVSKWKLVLKKMNQRYDWYGDGK